MRPTAENIRIGAKIFSDILVTNRGEEMILVKSENLNFTKTQMIGMIW